MAEQIMAEELKEKLRTIFTDIGENDLNKMIQGLGRYWSEDIESCLIFLLKKPVPVTTEERGADGRLLGWKMVERPREINKNLYPFIEDIAKTLGKTAVLLKGDDEVIRTVIRALTSYEGSFRICNAIQAVNLGEVGSRTVVKFVAEVLEEISPLKLFRTVPFNGIFSSQKEVPVSSRYGEQLAYVVGIVGNRTLESETIIAVAACLKKYVLSLAPLGIFTLVSDVFRHLAYRVFPDYSDRHKRDCEVIKFVAQKLGEDEMVKAIKGSDEKKLHEWVYGGLHLNDDELISHYLNPPIGKSTVRR